MPAEVIGNGKTRVFKESESPAQLLVRSLCCHPLHPIPLRTGASYGAVVDEATYA
jgi:hypothetical protein